jgi:hypothetical protein
MHDRPDRPQLLDQKPPPGRRLQRDLQLLTGEPPQKPAHPGAVGRAHPRASDLATIQIDPLGGDLGPMLVYPHHDRHPTNPSAREQDRPPDSANTPVSVVGAFR